MLGVMVIKNREDFSTKAVKFLSSGKLLPLFNRPNFVRVHFQ
jgi:hypothetical protein